MFMLLKLVACISEIMIFIYFIGFIILVHIMVPQWCKGMVLVSSSEPSYVMRIVISTLSGNREGRFYKVSGISVLEDSSMMYFKAFRESYSYIICHKGLNEVKNTLPYSWPLIRVSWKVRTSWIRRWCSPIALKAMPPVLLRLPLTRLGFNIIQVCLQTMPS